MTTLEISLPDEVNSDLEKLNLPKEETILSALHTYLQQKKRQHFEELLKEGYLSEHEENKVLLQEFKHNDLENWDDY